MSNDKPSGCASRSWGRPPRPRWLTALRLRTDWFFGVDMGIYYAPSYPPLVPDGFLSLGVERFIGEEGLLSYVLWEEDGIVPIFALEVVSKTYGGEYEKKKLDYALLGILLLRNLCTQSQISAQARSSRSLSLS